MAPSKLEFNVTPTVNHLREIRAARRITQLDLQIQTGITQTRISQFENGIIQPPPEAKQKIASVLGLPVAKVFPNEGGKKK